ncbi:MAG: hypothetical protein LQ350_004568 [Teloschistes chrysophthalmus]|nr:MAG: hypothetical protein LQ350_004568 [Niorma chrysophthalma]
MAAAQSSSDLAAATAFEKSQFVNGSVTQDAFYKTPSSSAGATPGTLLKVEADANASAYNLPPGTAVSRFMYQSEAFDGTPVPASAYVLWPYQPLVQPGGHFPLVVWAHGTSGIFGDGAPSHLKNLYNHFAAPFPLALQSYVTVAPDYAGLGVEKTADGRDIVHQYLASPAHANDVFHAAQAAQEAFPRLMSEFVVMGHSQGGGAAWGAAQRQAIRPVKGYLGSIAISPLTNLSELPQTDNPLIDVVGAFMTPGMQTLFPDFQPKSLFTDIGWERWQTYTNMRAGMPVGVALLIDVQLLKQGWRNDSYIKEFVNLTANGGAKIEGPLYVIQGEDDPNMHLSTTTSGVDKTSRNYPDSQLEYLTLPGIGHDPAMFASQRNWLDWIAKRFAGVPVKAGVQRSQAPPTPQPMSAYKANSDWILTKVTEPFELA